MESKRILVLLTGGTIAGNVANSKGNFLQSSINSVCDSASDILKEQFRINIDLQIQELLNVDSSDFLPEYWVKIISAIELNYDSYDAFIVLHGTNTMGYTSAALSFAFENINKPIILTGSQVPMGYLGSDAVTNLVNAIRLAVWQEHKIMGVIAVFGSKILAGVRVKKTTDFDYDPFVSFIKGGLGQIGRAIRIDDIALEKHNSFLSKTHALATNRESLIVSKNFNSHLIASLTEFPGLSKDIFSSLVENSGVKAFILRAYGAGDVSMTLVPALLYLKEKGIPIVVTTQSPNGVASFQVNENGKYLAEHKLAIPAFDMNIESMTTKLAWLLGKNLSYQQICQEMINNLHGEINVTQEN